MAASAMLHQLIFLHLLAVSHQHQQQTTITEITDNATTDAQTNTTTDNETITTPSWPPLFPFSSRSGHILQYVSTDRFLLFGGKLGSQCLSDLWTSATGQVWNYVPADPSQSRPTGAFNAASAVDGSGCLWLLGGECNAQQGVLWKTCDSGQTWSQLPRPTVLPDVDLTLPVLPAAFSGHAITILGDWQLVIVDASDAQTGAIWRSLDRDALYVQRAAAAPLPFGHRRHPGLTATSGGVLYLLGGYTCDSSACPKDIYNDVWASRNGGTTWECQTASFRASLFPVPLWAQALVMAHDDTMFLIAGRYGQAALNLMISSRPGAADTVFDSTQPLWISPPRWGRSFSLCFSEAIQANAQHIQIYDLVADAPVPAAVNVSRQVLSITAEAQLMPGRRHEIRVLNGSVSDLAGNEMDDTLVYQFDVSADVTPPKVFSVLPTGAGVDPWTTVVLTMTEAVFPGDGSLVLDPSVGQQIGIGINEATIVDRKVFFELPGTTRLTEGMEYSIRVPLGLLKDGANNRMEAFVSSFTVLSGVYTSTSYSFSNGHIPDAGSYNSSGGGPTLVASHPPDGATDVPAHPGVGIVLVFSVPVEFNGTGTINFEGSTLADAVQLDVATASSTELTTMPNRNAVKIKVPWQVTNGVKWPLLRRGGTYSVKVDAGVIVDAAGNSAGEVSISFKCLAGNLDTSPPFVVMSSPYDGQQRVPNSTTRLDLWFSEAVKANSGGITLVRPGQADTVFPVDSSTSSLVVGAAVIDGPKLSLTVPSGFLASAGLHTLEFARTLVKDLERTSEGGGNQMGSAFSMSFSVVGVDSDGPVLDAAKTSAQPSVDLPVSAPILLTFNEAVQAGTGAIVMSPRYLPGARVRIAATRALLAGPEVFAAPSADLQPGQSYVVSVERNAFLDVHGNGMDSIPNVGTRTIKSHISFARHSSPFTARFFTGAAVDNDNKILVVGGQEEVSLAARYYLDDVWQLHTQKPTNCASALEPVSECTCVVPASGIPPTFGTTRVARKVWRAARGGGTSCENSVSGIVSIVSQACQCPMCLSPPAAPLPANIDELSLRSFVPVSAINGDWALQCVTGYEPSDRFRCGNATGLVGAFEEPYPECRPVPCRAPPAVTGIARFVQFNAADSTGGLDCGSLSSGSAMPHEGNCSFACQAGWTASKALVCNFGTFMQASCVRQQCALPPASSLGNPVLRCGGSQSPSTQTSLGDQCGVTCAAGFYPAAANTSCSVASSAQPETAPALLQSVSCLRNTCGELSPEVIASASVEYNGQAFDDTVVAFCNDGYEATDRTGLQLACKAVTNLPGNVEVQWVSVLSGAAPGPVCKPVGGQEVIQASLVGVFEANLVPPGSSTIQALCSNSSFLAGVSRAIEDSWKTIDSAVSEGDVTNVALSVCSAQRRLGQRRHLASGTIQYTMPCTSQGECESKKALASGGTEQAALASGFSTSLLQRTSVEAQGVVARTPEVQVSYSFITTTSTTTTITVIPEVAAANDDDGIDWVKILFGVLVGVNVFFVFACLLFCVWRQRKSEAVFPQPGMEAYPPPPRMEAVSAPR